MSSPSLSRRRFIAISAALAGSSMLPGTSHATSQMYRWKGSALGTGAELVLNHPDRAYAKQTILEMVAETRRLESIFSLYQENSELSRLNRSGVLLNPSVEFLTLLSEVGRVHTLTEGAFDPTVQPLWSLYADRLSATGMMPDERNIEKSRALVGFDKVSFSAGEIRFLKQGMALTLNGIAQGYITDRIADLLHLRGFDNILVNMGEIAAAGLGNAGEDGWKVRLQPGGENTELPRVLKNRAVATSRILGTTFDEGEQVSHVLDPVTGHPALSDITGASVITKSATLSDALSTAALVCGEQKIRLAIKRIPGAGVFFVKKDNTVSYVEA